jgi:small neutral amino acid transporter SnatA (MarC family)
MSETAISTNIVMKHSKKEDVEVLGVVLSNLVIALCCLFLVYSCAIEPLIQDPQNRETVVVASTALLVFLSAKQIKHYYEK